MHKKKKVRKSTGGLIYFFTNRDGCVFSVIGMIRNIHNQKEHPVQATDGLQHLLYNTRGFLL